MSWLPIGHVGHYAWVLYVPPMLVVLAVIIRSLIEQRREGRGENGEPQGEGPAGGSE